MLQVCTFVTNDHVYLKLPGYRALFQFSPTLDNGKYGIAGCY